MNDPNVSPSLPTALEPTSPLPPPPPNTVFRGPNGIRAGWRVLIFLALVLAITLILLSPFALMRVLSQGGDQSLA